MEPAYYTSIEIEACASFEEKKSRFIGYAAPCKTEENALSFIRRIRTKHADARHNVYAYVLQTNQLSRYTDDGEPQGTAGLPVLDVLRKNQITDACIVVTRYFGGVLLGTGGLVRAYTAAAKLAVEAAGVVTREPYQMMSLSCGYGDYQKLQAAFTRLGLLVDDTVFTDTVTAFVACKVQHLDRVKRELNDLSGGNILICETGTRLDHS